MKLFVWDFHGTLEKDNENSVLEISNKVLEKLGYKERLTEEDSQKLYGRKWLEYFAYLLPDEPEEVHFKIQQACHDYEKAHPEIIHKNIVANDHAGEVLQKVKVAGHDQILISNMADDALEMFLKSVNLEKYFLPNKAFATNSHLSLSLKTKKDLLSEYLKNKSFDEIIVIGDTPGDIDLKNVAGGISYLYAHPNKIFQEVESDHKIHDLREVLKEIG